jgi:MoaA/NifB/PqqE/SkfB family radical SAM enzyme
VQRLTTTWTTGVMPLEVDVIGQVAEGIRNARFIGAGMKRLFDGRPLHAQLVVTYECNLSCAYCHEYTHGAPLVPFRDLAARIDALAALGVVTYDVLGGEPLLHPDIVAVVRRLKRQRGGANLVTVITNGFKLTPELVDGLNDAGLDCLQVSVDTIEPTVELPKSLRSVLPRLAILAAHARFAVKIQTVLTDDSWRRYGEFRALLAPFDFEFGFSLLHDDAGHIAIRGAHFAELLGRHALFPGMAFFRRHAAEMLVGDFTRPWKCLGGYKYLYVNADGRAQYCSQVAGAGKDVTQLTLADLRAADVHKACEAGCAIGCVRTVSHAVERPLAAVRTSVALLADVMRPRPVQEECPRADIV